MLDKSKKGNKVDIELDEKVSEGTFSNLALINHSGTEFIVDFIQLLPGMPKAKVKSRIILSPEHAKKLMHALHDNVKKYEKNFGEIKNSSVSSSENIIHFGEVVGEA